jgi:hypothetical protein
MDGPDGFTAGLAAYGAAPTTIDRHIVYKVEVVEGRFAGRLVETAVAIDEVSRWPLVPPHWIYLHDTVTFAATNTQPLPPDRRLGHRPRPDRWVGRPHPRRDRRSNMSIRTTSVAMTTDIAGRLRRHVDRPDGQEDICLVTYRPSTGTTRHTGLITSVITPEPGERHVHGNASIEGEYVLRAAAIAHARGDGLGLCHSRPGGHGWQQMNAPDWDAEASFANLVRELTGHPLIGITYAGHDRSWSARHWDLGVGTDVEPTHCDNVRVIGDTLDITWNNDLVPAPRSGATQRRSVSCWGPNVHADLTRRKVLVVGAGSVGLDVALRLAGPSRSGPSPGRNRPTHSLLACYLGTRARASRNVSPSPRITMGSRSAREVLARTDKCASSRRHSLCTRCG